MLSHNLDEDVIFDGVCDRILRMIGDIAATSGAVEAVRVGSFGQIRAETATSLAMIITELCQKASLQLFISHVKVGILWQTCNLNNIKVNFAFANH